MQFDVADLRSVERAFSGAELVFAMSMQDVACMNSPSGTFEKPVGALGEEGTGLADVAKAADVKMFIRSGQPPPFNGFQMITQYINTKLYRRMYPGVPPVPLLPKIGRASCRERVS